MARRQQASASPPSTVVPVTSNACPKFDQASDEMKAKAQAHMDEALKAQSENNEQLCLEKLHMVDQELGGQ